MTAKTLLTAGASPRAMFYANVSNPLLRGPQVAYAPDDGALSVEQAISALRQPAAEPEQPAAEVEAPESAPEAVEPEAEAPPEPESEAEPTAEDLPDPEAVIEEPEVTEPESDPAAPVIAAPRSWDAAERATFATLPPAAQEIISKREAERDRAVSKAQQEAATARKTAEVDLANLAQYKTTFDQIATRANQVFADRWANVDWVTLARNDPAAYTVAKAEYDAHASELQRVQDAQAAASKVQQQEEQVRFQNYLREEFGKLGEIAPALADPKSGAEKRSQVAKFLLDQGIPQEALERISAVEMALAHDAMQFRQLKAQGKAVVAAKPAAQAPRPAAAPAKAAAPSAAPPARPTRQRSTETAMARLSQSGKTEDAMAVLRAMRGAS